MLYIYAFELPQEHTLLRSEGARLLVATMTAPLLKSLPRIADKATAVNTSTTCALTVSFHSHLSSTSNENHSFY
jgi:hypothetical protein